jgi:hypothetical protein
MLKGRSRVFMSLLGKLMRGQVIAFAMRRRGGLVGVRGFVVELGGSIVWALRHNVFSSHRRMPKPLYRPIHPPSTVRMVPVT